jgi:hypothetical protein
MKQFWALFQFQARLNSNLWRWVAFSFFFSLIGRSENLEFVILDPTFLVAVMVSPGFLHQAWKSRRVQNGSEFLLTRAVDRSILYRSNAAFVYLLVLVLPVLFLLFDLHSPGIHFSLPPSISPQFALSHMPGSTVTAGATGDGNGLFAPFGRLLAGSWRLWTCLAAIGGIQMLFLCRFGFVRWITGRLNVYGQVLLLCAAMAFVFLYFQVPTNPLWLFWFFITEHVFFAFAAHQILFWILTLPLMVANELWCERRFARLEQ